MRLRLVRTSVRRLACSLSARSSARGNATSMPLIAMRLEPVASGRHHQSQTNRAPMRVATIRFRWVAATDRAPPGSSGSTLKPDVVLMDIQMPRLDGVEATRQIVADPGTRSRVIILTTFERDDYIFEALRAGASGFLLKNAPPEELLHAVRVVANGNALLSPSVTRRVIEQYATTATVPKHVEDDLARLTDREREVLCSLASGKNNAEVATSLYVSEGTVKTHVSHILTKLALRDRMQAVVFAYESGLITPGG